MISWPAGVNTTILNDASWGPEDALLRSTTRSGKDKTRLKSSSVPDSISVTMIFTESEYEIFDSWFRLSLRRGALTFQFKTIIGTGYSEYEIYSVPKYSQYGATTVKCTMTWRVL